MKVKIGNRVVDAEITTAHAMSSHGIPVLVVDGQAYGPAEVGHMRLVEATQDEREALLRGGYRLYTGRGRPPIGRRLVQTTILLPADVMARLDAVAADADTTRTALIRQIITDALETWEV